MRLRCAPSAGRRPSSAAIHGALLAVVVETPATARQPFDQGRDLQETIDDAVDLGAEVVRVEAKDLLSGIEEVARTRRATHLVLPYHGSTGFRRVLDRPLVDQLMERLPDVELHIVGATGRRS